MQRGPRVGEKAAAEGLRGEQAVAAGLTARERGVAGGLSQRPRGRRRLLPAAVPAVDQYEGAFGHRPNDVVGGDENPVLAAQDAFGARVDRGLHERLGDHLGR
ncbi:MAG: hypothetical protein ACR2NB_08900 [Solirubrobacteraceae bacterium]